MKLIDKSNSDEPVHLSFDAAQAALASGAYEMHPTEGERGPDQPTAQSPKPGTDPVGGKEEAKDGQVLTNLTEVGIGTITSPGLPMEPARPAENVVAAPKSDAPPAQRLTPPPKPEQQK